jgi:hypothetical protein
MPTGVIVVAGEKRVQTGKQIPPNHTAGSSATSSVMGRRLIIRALPKYVDDGSVVVTLRARRRVPMMAVNYHLVQRGRLFVSHLDEE